MPSWESEPDCTTSPLSTLSPLFEDNRDAVADSGGRAHKLGDVTDHLAAICDVSGLRVFNMTASAFTMSPVS
jgi:hypothetical protein